MADRQDCSRPGAAALFAFVLALVVRLVALVAYHGTPFTRVMVGDSSTYLELAREIARGRLGDLGVFFQSALYPFVLVPWAADETRVWLPVVVLQCLIASAACAAIAMTSSVVFADLPWAGWLSGGAAAVCGPWIFYDIDVLPASLAASLTAFALALLVLDPIPNRGWVLGAAGVLLGGAVLLAPGMLLFAGACLVWIFSRSGLRPRVGDGLRIAGFAAGVLIVLAPVTLHNLRAGDRVLVVSSGGVNAFIGNNPQATGTFFLPPETGLDGTRLRESARSVAERDLGTRLVASEVSSYWFDRARKFVVSEPSSWIRLVGRKALLTVNRYEIPNHLHFQFVVDRFLPVLGWALPFWVVLSLSIVGVPLAWFGGGRPGRLTVIAVLATLIVPVMFFATARYRLPALPPMLVLAGGAVAWLSSRASWRPWGRPVAVLAIAGAVALISHITIVREGDYAFDHLLLAQAERRIGNLDAAVLELKLAVETASGPSKAGLLLAQALEERGNRRTAMTVLKRHVQGQPGDRVAAQLLATWRSQPLPGTAPDVPHTDYEIGTDLLNRGGDAEAAIEVLARAVERDPIHVRAMVNLGVARSSQRRFAEAFRWLERALRLAPDNPAIWRNLARIYMSAGNREAALEAAQSAATLAPDDPATQSLLNQIREEGARPES